MDTPWLRRRWLDFRFGHSLYLIFGISLANFVLIFHRLLIERIDFLSGIFENLWFFTIVFIIIYIPVSVIVGAWHRKTQLKVESTQTMNQNPVMAKMVRNLLDVIDGKATKEEIEQFRKFLLRIENGNS
ncbi:MAG: hypothetical protein OEM21_09845 [Nitrosopumilus sp.]|nr:hypothetical protein [Nitrosopumilus sp.]